MRKYIYLCQIVFWFGSCQPDIVDREEEQQTSTAFSYERVEYVFDENTYMKRTIKEYPEIVIENNTSVEQTYIDNPGDYFKESSNFWSANVCAFSYIDSLLFVKTPIDVVGDRFVYDDGTKWLYSEKEQKKKPLIESSKILQIQPGHKLIIYPSVTFKEIFTSYKVHLKGVEHGEELVVRGDWSGVIFLDYNADYVDIPL